MQKTTRRRFLKFAGAGSAIAAAAAIPVVEPLLKDRNGPVAIRAVGGVPAAPLPSYASYVLDGYVDPIKKTGTLTRTLLAGHPDAASAIALPGLSQTVQVTDVRMVGALLQVRGVIVDRSQLAAGENADLEITVDRKAGVVWIRSGANEMKLALQP